MNKHTDEERKAAREGRRLKREGRQRAADQRHKLLNEAQDIAEATAFYKVDGVVSAVDVRRAMDNYEELGNAAGSIFSPSVWEHAGYTETRHAAGHARTIKTWKLRK